MITLTNPSVYTAATANEHIILLLEYKLGQPASNLGDVGQQPPPKNRDPALIRRNIFFNDSFDSYLARVHSVLYTIIMLRSFF